jgi:hypothetical protein
VLAYRKHIPHSPSAQRLLRQSDLIWTTFQTLLELKRETSRALAEAILDRGECLGLHMHEVQALLKITESKEEKGETSDENDRRRGAGRGAVILGRGTET